jgi:hypothetical protein
VVVAVVDFALSDMPSVGLEFDSANSSLPCEI